MSKPIKAVCTFYCLFLGIVFLAIIVSGMDDVLTFVFSRGSVFTVAFFFHIAVSVLAAIELIRDEFLGDDDESGEV